MKISNKISVIERSWLQWRMAERKQWSCSVDEIS